MVDGKPMIRLNDEPGFSGVDAPAEADLYRCVHCGLCLSACPTYTQLGVETESPRGRIALMKAVHEGRLGISERVVSHWEMCLQCRACEAVCPSGVPYGRIMEYSRAQVLAQDKQGAQLKRVTRWFLRSVLAHSGRLRAGGRLLRAYQRWGPQKLLRASRVLDLLPGGLGRMEAQMPVMDREFFGPSKEVYRARGQRKATVGLLSGCVMPLMQGETMRAAVRVLTRNGCDVVAPEGQGCCGALHLHAGDLESGRELARRNIDVFLEAGVDSIVTASAGCGSSMKEYQELLKDDAEYGEKAARFSALTQDITQFLAGLPWERPRARLERRVTYQDPCHLAHAQRITQEPRLILESIPGVRLVEMEQAAMCCGSAGFYSMVQPELSGKILDSKLDWVEATGAEQVVTANPGCMMQIETGLRQRGISSPVVHVVDILDEAYRLEDGGD